MQMKTLLIIGSLLAAAELTYAEAPQEMEAPSVLVEKVIELTESAPRKYVGKLSPIEEVAIRARVPGYITGVKFNEGDFVKAGQLLFEIEDDTYAARVEAAKAVCEQSLAELEFAKTNYKRQKELFDKLATSQSSIDEAIRLLRLNEAKYMAAKAALTESKTQLSYTKIYSPIDGVIGKMFHTKGNLVGTNSDLLADVVKFDPIYTQFAISEGDYIILYKSNPDNLRQTAKVRVQLADGSLYPEVGTVSFIDNTVDSETGTIMLWATIPNPNKNLIPGSLITVSLNKKVDKGMPAVKISAPGLDREGDFVYVINDKNIAERRSVKLGAMIGNMQLVPSGLEVGEKVVVDGTHKVRANTPINPITSTNAEN